MSFTASDVSSLAQSLHGWEWAEYISEGFVILACAGELIADFGEKRLGQKRKRRLERTSTMLLVAALSAALICLAKTNELAGGVIGSLGHQAEEAGNKAGDALAKSSTALMQAKDALSKTGASEEAMKRAEDGALKAHTAASNALTLARDARQEAGSFERDIVSAKEQAAKAESHLAEALQRAADATEQLNRIKSPRSLTRTPELIAALEVFKGTEYTFAGLFADQEAGDLLRAIDDALQRAGWKRVQSPHKFPALEIKLKDENVEIPETMSVGLQVMVDAPEAEKIESLQFDKLPPLVKTAIAMNVRLFASLFPPQEGDNTRVKVTTGTSPIIRIIVGKKP